MAENVQFTGRLGLERRKAETLSAAVSAVVDTLDDFGQPAETIEARAENTARLQCDHYLVTVRLRRVPLLRASKLTGSVMQPSSLLELSLSPISPGYCDREISELLLAEMLRRLLPAVEATSVEWLDTEVALTCEQFLGAFEPTDSQVKQPERLQPVIAVTGQLQPAKPARPRGRACFTPIEQTAQQLEAHCDLAFQAARLRKAASATTKAAGRARMRDPMHPGDLRGGLGSRLRASALSVFNLAGTGRMRFISHLLLLTALSFYLESAGMVQAARPLLP